MAIVDLSLLAAPDVVDELDYETILAERKATLVSLYPEEQQEAVARTLTLESEPIVKLLQENAYREVIWRQRVNESARAVMLAYAAGNDLDNIGANFSVGRLVITPAEESTLPPTPAVMESDTDYRLRIQQAFEGMSVAGSGGAYQFHGRSADGRVADIPATASYGGYQAYQPVTAPAGRSYIDQSKSEYNITLQGGVAQGGDLDRQLRDAVDKLDREKRARQRSNMRLD